MQKPRIIIYQTLIRKFFFVITFFLIFSCSQNNPKQPKASEEKGILKPPVVIKAKAPVVTHLDTCPPPRTTVIPTRRGGSYIVNTINGPTHIQLLPPQKTPADFFVSLQHLNSEQSLYLNCTDKNGNLWCSNGAGGVSRYDGRSFTNFFQDYTVSHIREDKNGIVWIATMGNGIGRYDGKSFTNYTTDNGLPNNNVLCVYEDKNENLWFGHGEGQVSRLNRDDKSLPGGQVHFTTFTVARRFENNWVFDIREDNNGNFWFGTNGDGVTNLIWDENNPTNKPALSSYTTGEGLSGNVVYCVVQDRNGNLWCGTDGGVTRFQPDESLASGQGRFSKFDTTDGLPGNRVPNILEDRSGNMWFASNGGVSQLNSDDKFLPAGQVHFSNLTVAQGLVENTVTNIVEDKNGDLWFTSEGGIISRYGGKSFTSYSAAQGLPRSPVTNTLEDKEGDFWFSTFDGGLCRLSSDKKFFTNYTTAQGLANNNIRNLIEDKNGNLWFVTSDSGVSRLDKSRRSLTNYTTNQGLAANSVYFIFGDRGGNLWFSTHEGVSRLDKGGKFFMTYTTAQGLGSNEVTAILQDENGDLWFGTYGGGVSQLDDDGKFFTNYTTGQGLINDTVINILEDKNGNLWLGTVGGVSRLQRDRKSFLNYTTSDGLVDNVIAGIVEDKQGMIWVGTKFGLSGLKFIFKRGTLNGPKDSAGTSIRASNSFTNDELRTSYDAVFESYNSKNGYPGKGLNNRSMYVDTKGIIWAGAVDKLVRFDYSAIHKNSDPPNVFIQSVKLNNKNICWYDLIQEKPKTDSSTIPPNIIEEASLFGKALSETQRDTMREKFSGVIFDSITRFYPVPVGLVLPYSHNNITFDFAAIEPARPNVVGYKYMLEGYDYDWSPINDKTTATFGNMHEGQYTFKLKARSPDGIWSEPLTYYFKVLPPWHRTWWAYTLYIVSLLAAIWVFVKWRIKALRKEKVLLEEKVARRTHELQEEKEKVESALTELKAAQSQLIQSEKMASLGELTAGIAHEIQNPLNFVNNFSEVNKELLAEMNGEIERGNFGEVKNIAKDVINNEEKINHHGKRADTIVKGMLQHSKSSAGQKELTDINKLADEYLRLSYHGFRAKDKTFNAEIKTDFDNTIGKINIVPQDIGRVLLNLYNNAFYVVNEKKKQNVNGYEPTVSVSTKKINGKIEIKVADNGNGILQKVLDKIFQPFFTTKPTGQGTGLGLSLSYDIVKAHGGEIKVDSTESEFAEFVIQLPITV